jgi:hypothetical protein
MVCYNYKKNNNYYFFLDWQKLVSNIEKNENKRKRMDDFTFALEKKVSLYENPFNDLKIQYSSSQKGVKFTEEEDRFLLCKTVEVGYGNWLLLKNEIRKDSFFQFNWFLKSRNPFDLGKRVEQLIRIIQKEFNNNLLYDQNDSNNNNDISHDTNDNNHDNNHDNNDSMDNQEKEEIENNDSKVSLSSSMEEGNNNNNNDDDDDDANDEDNNKKTNTKKSKLK